MQKVKYTEINEANPNYEYFNGFGGFVNDGTEYEILLEGNNKPPAPWINVIANKKFGFHISESGAGFTWASNSRENKITPWSNDPVSDKISEVIYIKDDLSGKLMTPVSMGKTDRGTYKVRHGFGYSSFYHEEEDTAQQLNVYTPLEEPLKIWELNLTNNSEYERYFTYYYYVEWVLGVDREQTGPYILTSFNNEYEYFTAKSIYNYDYRKHYAFLFSSEMINGYTGDRQEFLGTKGSVFKPAGTEKKLSCDTGVCYDSCGVIQVSIAVKPKETKKVLFGLGYSDDSDEIEELRKKYQDIRKSDEEKLKIKNYWDEILGKIRVSTNDRAIDIMANGWLIYQTISCRMNARAAFYQCGGAYGFRDQLQDALSLLYTKPEALRNQIIISASRQFKEGDVQHWWHPPTGVGVRTRITDDLLWLPYNTAAYIRTTGDETILKEMVPYIRGVSLEDYEHEIMITPDVSDLEESVYEHCKKAIMHAQFGLHGLPLMGGGDWNDGMNKVGIEGKGESLWLAWFYYAMAGDFIPVCQIEGDNEFADFLKNKREELIKRIEEHGWDGEWYLRAYYDDSSKMGSKESDECIIDSISQSWSVISKGADPERAHKAMQSAYKYLVKEEEGISLLLSPPFDKTEKNPGYIKNYYPGIRENGGQYTHAAVWLAIASGAIGDYNMCYNLFSMLNPINTAANKKDSLKYEREPYVMIADISLGAPYTGRGGWSWYTGSAGWMYQGLVKWFLGLKIEKNKLMMEPAIPANFGDYSIEYKFEQTIYTIRVSNRKDNSTINGTLNLDGKEIEGNTIDLVDDGLAHEVIYSY